VRGAAVPNFPAFCIALVLLAIAPIAPAQTSERVALVIGNSAYQQTPKLANPRNDAADLSTALKKLGFEVVEGYDLEKAAFDRKVRDFAAALHGASAGLFFFAGHGLQVAGQNYLVPVDAQLTTASALEFEMVRVDVVQRVMEQEANTNILFLDACRDNPLARNLARAMGTRSAEIGRGLAPLVSGVGTLISFSTQPGNTALDGTGRNSPFAGALVKHMSASRDDLSTILISVRNDVMKETQDRQVPWEHSALRGRFYFNMAQQTTGQSPRAWQLSEAAEAWDRTKDTDSIVVLELFVARYQDTYYADLARLRIAELKKRQAAVTMPALAPKAEKSAGERAAEKAAKAQRDFDEGDRYYLGRGVSMDFVKAAEAWERAAAAGHAGAMNGLGWLHENGMGVAKDFGKARDWYEKSAALGNLDGVSNMGRVYREGLGVRQDYAKARELFEKAVAAGNSDAMVNLGWLYQNGWGVTRDAAKARELFEKAIAAGNLRAGNNNLGNLYLDGLGVTRDYSKARELFEKAAAAGNDFHAMRNLGWLYYNGLGVPKDYVRARQCFEKSATAGNVLAMADLGGLYRDGLDGQQDYTAARQWFERAAALGHGASMNELGVLFEFERGVSRDFAMARQWYEKAAAAGNDFGMNNVGRSFEAGWSGASDYGKAREWYEKATASGNRFAQGNLAKLLDQGKGGTVDFQRAAKLALDAARSGNNEMLEALRGDMQKWSKGTRVELKRELVRVGGYKGPVDDVWDYATRASVAKYLGQGR
jgi:uncharacterized protein